MDIQKQQEVTAPVFRFKGGTDMFYADAHKPLSGDQTEHGRHASKKITIAIADDSAIQHKIWGLLINQDTALELVCLAYNGQDLIRQIETSVRIPDICILDLEMPVMNGVCTAKRLSQRFPTIKVFGCTSCEDEHLRTEMRKNNVIAVFSKTENRTLLHTISQLQHPAAASCNS
ncbi:MAG: response regulator [Niabella sp.]|nr:response regulator [Niabella sp.]